MLHITAEDNVKFFSQQQVQVASQDRRKESGNEQAHKRLLKLRAKRELQKKKKQKKTCGRLPSQSCIYTSIYIYHYIYTLHLNRMFQNEYIYLYMEMGKGGRKNHIYIFSHTIYTSTIYTRRHTSTYYTHYYYSHPKTRHEEAVMKKNKKTHTRQHDANL